jgi:hypothetical protein
MHLGMLKHLLEWTHAFLKNDQQLECSNNLWLSVLSYLTLTAPNITYIRKKRSRAHAGLRGSRGLHGCAVDRVGGAGTCSVKATCVRTLPTAGVTRDRERPDVDIPRARTWTVYGIPGVAEVKANM